MNEIKDYLQTQGLVLDADVVAVNRAAIAAVMNNGMAHIEDDVLCAKHLPEQILSKKDLLKQMFMALDSAYSRDAIQSVAIYARLPDGDLCQLTAQGAAVETHLTVNDNHAWQYLAVRTAQSAWANVADNVDKWLDLGELQGEHNRRAVFQAALPICGEDGVLFGVLLLENNDIMSDEQLAQWVGVALAVLPILRAMLPENITEQPDES